MFVVAGALFILLAISVSAVCEDPLIPYHACQDACPDILKDTLGATECSNDCIAAYGHDQDTYYACEAAERAKAQQNFPPQTPSASAVVFETGITDVRGDVKLLRDGKVTPITEEFRIAHDDLSDLKENGNIPENGVITPPPADEATYYDGRFEYGDVIDTGNGAVTIKTDDGNSEFGKDSLVEMIAYDDLKGEIIKHGTIDPSTGLDESDFRYVSDSWMQREVMGAIVEYLKSPAMDEPYRITVDGFLAVSYYLHRGAGWFIDKAGSVKKRIVFTQTTAVTPIGTEYTVTVNDDGSTTVVTLDGAVVVTDQVSLKSVLITANKSITVPVTENGLTEQELQQAVKSLNPDSLDHWWLNATEKASWESEKATREATKQAAEFAARQAEAKANEKPWIVPAIVAGIVLVIVLTVFFVRKRKS